ncbi:MAG: hypothetical protein ACJ8H8_12945, partial [Geminicoccaceae bacterium]
RSFGAEILLGLAVLAVTATFPLSPPPRALAATPDIVMSDGLTVVASGRAGQAVLTLLPGHHGPNELQAWVTDLNGAPVVGRAATIAWALPTAGIEPLRASAALTAPGSVTFPALDLPRPGRWQLRLDILVDDFTKLTFEGDIDLP